jgi:hypothetical protein
MHDALQEYAPDLHITSSHDERSELLNLFWESFRHAYDIDSIRDNQTISQLPQSLVHELADRAKEMQLVYDHHSLFSASRILRSHRPAPHPAPSAAAGPAGN